MIKFTQSVQFSGFCTFTRMCNHHHNLMLEYFHHSWSRNIIPVSSHSLPSTLLGDSESTSVGMDLPVLEIVSCVVCCVSFSPSVMFSRAIHVAACLSTHRGFGVTAEQEVRRKPRGRGLGPVCCKRMAAPPSLLPTVILIMYRNYLFTYFIYA